ncbi:MAG: DUF4342 domain-containing protein [bacterium]
MEQFKINSQELLKKIEELIKEGNVRRIIVKDANGKTYLEIPLTIGVIGVLAAPVVAAIGAVAGLIANFKFEIIRKEDGKEIEIIEIKEDKKE